MLPYLFEGLWRECFRSRSYGSSGTAGLLSRAWTRQLEALKENVNIENSSNIHYKRTLDTVKAALSIIHKITSKLSSMSCWPSVMLLTLSKLFHGRKSKTSIPSIFGLLSIGDGPPLAHLLIAIWVAVAIGWRVLYRDERINKIEQISSYIYRPNFDEGPQRVNLLLPIVLINKWASIAGRSRPTSSLSFSVVEMLCSVVCLIRLYLRYKYE